MYAQHVGNCSTCRGSVTYVHTGPAVLVHRPAVAACKGNRILSLDLPAVQSYPDAPFTLEAKHRFSGGLQRWISGVLRNQHKLLALLLTTVG